VNLKFLPLTLLLASGASAQSWRQVWSDEFNGTGFPDSTKWGYEEGFVRNQEKQLYTRGRLENARLEQGCLVIESRRESFEGADYTSASVYTKGRAAWTYGRIEVRAKLPAGRGMWPAIWTLGTSIDSLGWPRCGEIDIMEYVGFDPDRIHSNVHFAATRSSANRNVNHASLVVSKPSGAFHVYAMEWTPERISFFVDSIRYATVRKPKPDAEAWPFDRPQYLILNTAVGGAWGGEVGVDDAVFPQRFTIDYVRVYQEARRGSGR
jgi:beta-glucanase (GH16 family)